MKPFHTLTLGLSVLILISCGQKEATQSETEETVVVAVTPNATTTLDIEGMTCEMGCKAAIEKHLNKTHGVANCAVDFEKAIAVIEYDNTVITEDQLIAEVGEVANHAYKARKHKEADHTEEATPPTAQ